MKRRPRMTVDGLTLYHIDWPPPHRSAKRRDHGTRRIMAHGEPALIDLVRDYNDRALHGDEFVVCCDCQLVHHTIYEVVRAPDTSRFFLKVRSYRDERSTLLERRARRARKGRR